MTTLRDDYDPNNIPVNSSAIHRIDASMFELEIEEDVVDSSAQAANSDIAALRATFSHRVTWRIRMQRLFDVLVLKIYHSRWYQVCWAMILVLAAGMLYVTLNHRIEHIDDDVVLMRELGELDTQLLMIEQRWSRQEMQDLQNSVQLADTRRVFLDYRRLALWLSEKNEYANQLGLKFSYRLGDREASDIDDMFEVPIDVRLVAAPDVEQVYQRALEFLKRVVGTAYYVEISEATLRGDGAGADELVATLRVWVHGTFRENSGVE